LKFHFLLLLPGCLLAEFSSEIGLGGDYTNQRYSALVLDTLTRDTTTRETEGRSFWSVNLSQERNQTRLEAANNLSLSTLSVRDLLDLELEQQLAASLQLKAGYEGELRWYHHALPATEDSGFQRNYLNSAGRLELEWQPSDRFEVRVKERLENQHYTAPDSLYYDYLLNRAGVMAGLELGVMSSLDAGYDWSARRAAGVDSQDYQDHSLRLEYSGFPGADWQVRLAADASRRSYADPTRSLREGCPSVSLGYDFTSAVSVFVEDELRLTWYDAPDPVYRNQSLNTLGLNVELRPTAEITLRLGPAWESERGLQGTAPEDYQEIALKAGFEFMKPGRLWVSLDDRLGVRRYVQGDSSYQTSFVFNELDATLNWTLLTTRVGSLVLDGTASIAPEWHADQTDNLAVSTYTLQLKFAF
jgi:hypothetical protein